ncbi:hypothetical protein SPWS13_0763 [Shewanella putrefaciens]|nr:hypothetical protein SPWS13_0763 [Shewanella putrefaciens]
MGLLNTVRMARAGMENGNATINCGNKMAIAFRHFFLR